MRLLGALAFGTFAFFLVGMLTGNAPELKKRSKARPQTSQGQVWLIQAGLDVTPRQFWIASAAVGFVAYILFSVITGSPSIALVPAISVALIPRGYFARKRVGRLREIQEAWPDAIRELISSIQANSSLHGALVELSRNGPEALRESLVRFPNLASTLGVVPALEIIREEMADATSDRVLEVLILAHERGGGIVIDILRDLAESTTEDVRVLAEIETNALEQKINARAVFIIPWFTLILLTLQDGAFRDFYRSPAGFVVVLIGVVISLVGLFWLSRLGREPVEERVFGGSALTEVVQ